MYAPWHVTRHSASREPSGRAAAGAWIIALAVLAAVIGAVLRLSELEEIGRLLRRIRPAWLLTALALQAATYYCAAAVWQAALAARRRRVSTRSLVPLSLAMLFVNQAVPSAGLSGSAVVLRALRLRGIGRTAAMAALLLGFVTAYIAYLIAVAVSLVVLTALHRLNVILVATVAVFTVGAVALPAGVVWYTRAASSPAVRRRLGRAPVLGPVLTAMAAAPADVLRNVSLLQRAVALQLLEIALDASTLYVALRAIGVVAFPPSVFASFVMAYVVARAIPVPLGLGTFEGTAIGMLHLADVGIEAALAATLMFRAFTLWLPMLPGLWCTRVVLKRHR